MPKSRKRRPPVPPRPRPAAPPPPRSFGPHFRGALRELLRQHVAGWRITALVLILIGGLGGGQAASDALGLTDGWAVAGVQAVCLVLSTLALAALIALGRWRNARRL